MVSVNNILVPGTSMGKEDMTPEVALDLVKLTVTQLESKLMGIDELGITDRQKAIIHASTVAQMLIRGAELMFTLVSPSAAKQWTHAINVDLKRSLKRLKEQANAADNGSEGSNSDSDGET